MVGSTHYSLVSNPKDTLSICKKGGSTQVFNSFRHKRSLYTNSTHNDPSKHKLLYFLWFKSFSSGTHHCCWWSPAVVKMLLVFKLGMYYPRSLYTLPKFLDKGIFGLPVILLTDHKQTEKE